MSKIVIYYNFIFITVLTVIGFLSAESTAQIISSVLFFPLAIYFANLVIPRTKKAIQIIPPQLPSKELSKKEKKPIKEQKTAEAVLLPHQGFDMDKRMFLKIIGSAGFSIFFLSLFTQKAHGAFFGSVPGPGTISIKDSAGTKIDPSEKHPTDGYQITQIDDATPSYYGFVDKTGAWFIQKEDATGAYRYTKGASSFSTNWTNRAALTYDYFDVIF